MEEKDMDTLEDLVSRRGSDWVVKEARRIAAGERREKRVIANGMSISDRIRQTIDQSLGIENGVVTIRDAVSGVGDLPSHRERARQILAFMESTGEITRLARRTSKGETIYQKTGS